MESIDRPATAKAARDPLLSSITALIGLCSCLNGGAASHVNPSYATAKADLAGSRDGIEHLGLRLRNALAGDPLAIGRSSDRVIVEALLAPATAKSLKTR